MAGKNVDIRIILVASAALGLAAACESSAEGEPVTAENASYFSLSDYFHGEASRLQQQYPEIRKTVSKNGESESRNVGIPDWADELALFIESDINKPAWRNSYRADSAHTSIVYVSTDSGLRTQRIEIQKNEDGTVASISITNKAENMLYSTDERLDYYPDSLYRIAKQQRVRVIGDSDYIVTGNMK
jgi:hypothetical protein